MYILAANLSVKITKIESVVYPTFVASYRVELITGSNAGWTLYSDYLTIGMISQKTFLIGGATPHIGHEDLNHIITIVNDSTGEEYNMSFTEPKVKHVFKIEKHINSYIENEHLIYEIELTKLLKNDAINYEISISDISISNSKYLIHSIRNSKSPIVRLKVLRSNLIKKEPAIVTFTLSTGHTYATTIENKIHVDQLPVINTVLEDDVHSNTVVDHYIDTDLNVEYMSDSEYVIPRRLHNGHTKLNRKKNKYLNSRKVKVKGIVENRTIHIIDLVMPPDIRLNSVGRVGNNFTFNLNVPADTILKIKNARFVTSTSKHRLLFNGEVWDKKESTTRFLEFVAMAEDDILDRKIAGYVEFILEIAGQKKRYIYNI